MDIFSSCNFWISYIHIKSENFIQRYNFPNSLEKSEYLVTLWSLSFLIKMYWELGSCCLLQSQKVPTSLHHSFLLSAWRRLRSWSLLLGFVHLFCNWTQHKNSLISTNHFSVNFLDFSNNYIIMQKIIIVFSNMYTSLFFFLTLLHLPKTS